LVNAKPGTVAAEDIRETYRLVEMMAYRVSKCHTVSASSYADTCRKQTRGSQECSGDKARGRCKLPPPGLQKLSMQPLALAYCHPVFASAATNNVGNHVERVD